MSILRNWYIREDFDEGVQLLQQYAGNTAGLLNYLGKSYIPQEVRSLLEKRLNDMDFEGISTPQVYQSPIHNPQTLNSNPQLKEKSVLLLKERDSLRAKIRYEPDADNRLLLIRELMERVVPALDSVFDDIERFEKTGALPLSTQVIDDKEIDTDSFEAGLRMGIEKVTRLDNLTSRCSKLRGMMKRLKGEELKKYEKELQEKEAEILKLKAELRK